MSDETEFYRALANAGNYTKIYIEFELLHPTEPSREIIIDNVAQKGDTAFVFEGKSLELDDAVSQLKRDYLSIKFDREKLVKSGNFTPFLKIRLFYYSFRRGLLIEFTDRGKEVNQYSFDKRNIKQLTGILRKL